MITRDKTLDIAKGIGIITVVWAHIGPGCYFKSEIFLFHMPLFFVLSGYFFKDDHLSFIEIVKKRAKSYLLPYIIFYVIAFSTFALLYISLGLSSEIHVSPGMLIHPYGVTTTLWFLLSLFQVHIGYYLINKYIKKEWAKVAACILCLILGNVAYKWNIGNPAYIGSSFSMIIFFYIGVLIHKLHVLSNPKYRLLLFVSGIVFYSVGVITNVDINIKYNIIEGNLLLAALAAIGGSYIVIYISYLLNQYNKLSFINTGLNYLGQNTLIIFTLHLLCFEFAIRLFGFPLPNESSFLYEFLMTIWGIIGSLIIGYPIKKYILAYTK